MIRGQNLVRVTREQLRFLLAETTQEVDVDGTLATSTEPAPSYDEVLAQALKNRPELGEIDTTAGSTTSW